MPCLASLLAVVLVAGCAGDDAAEDAPARTPAPGELVADPDATISFVDATAAAGITFTHNTGAFGEKWLPETMGSGCAWVDYDTDGDPDALLLSGKDFEGHPTGRRQTMALFANDGGTFSDVTRAAGLATPIYAMGVTYGDYDADGDPDLYITALGPNRLYRNDAGVFVDVAARIGVADPGFGSSASWLDADEDGDLDLITLNYVKWSPETDIFCSLDGTNKSYCTPEAYQGASPILYRNDGDTFADVSAAAGIHDPTSKALGVVCFDYDADGRDDIFIANDTQPNFLFHNEGDGTFTERGLLAGIGFDEVGRVRGAMGVDIADFDFTGRPSLVVGNFSNEMVALYHNEGKGFFIDVAPTGSVGRQSLLTLAFGVLFLDVDLDGLQDLFVANGHVENEVQKIQERVTYAQPPHLFRNLGRGRFDDVAPGSPALTEPVVARGAAAADYDGDGDVDVLVTTSGGPAKLYRNDGADGSHGLRIRLQGGSGSNRDAYGAKVQVTASGVTRTEWLRAGHSYCSQSENVLTFGLGSLESADEVVVTWPSGTTSRVSGVAAGSTLLLEEPPAAR